MLGWVLFYLIAISTLFIRSRLLYLLAIVSVTFWAAIRYGVGYDYFTYYELTMSGPDGLLDRLQPAQNFLLSISFAANSPFLYFAASSSLISLGVFSAIRQNSRDVKFSTFFFLVYPLFFINSLSLIKQFCAIAIILWALKFIENRKLYAFVLAVGIASMFHQTAIVAVLLYFIKFLRGRIWFLILFAAPIVLKTFLLNQLERHFPYYYDWYILADPAEGGKYLMAAIGIYFLLILKSDTYKKLNHKEYLYALYCSAGIGIYVSLAEFGQASRIAYYFMAPVIFLVWRANLAFGKKLENIVRLTHVIAAFLSSVFVLYMGTVIADNKIFPYQSIINEF